MAHSVSPYGKLALGIGVKIADTLLKKKKKKAKTLAAVIVVRNKVLVLGVLYLPPISMKL